MAKATREERGLFELKTLRSFFITGKNKAGIQDRNLEAESEAEAVEKCCLLAWFAPLCLLNLLSYTIQSQLFRLGTTHNSLDPSTSIINQERTHLTCLQTNLMEAFSKWKVLLPK